MTDDVRRFGESSQIAFATRDIAATMRHFAQLGIGPWFVLPTGPLPNARHRGAAAHIEMAVAFANRGGMEYELLQQLNDTPSVWHDFLAGRPERERFHHHCLRTDDFDALAATMAAAGYAIALDGRTHRGRFAYLDHADRPGAYVELLEQSASRRAMAAHVRDAGAGWDGRDPIRAMPEI